MKPAAVPPAFRRAYANAHRREILQSSQQRKRKRSGDETEDFVEELHEKCEERGIAFVRKLPTPIRVIRRVGGGKVLGHFEEKSGVDYVGHMLDGSGRGVFAEIKRCTSRSFPLSRIEDHQRAELDRAHDAGAVSVVVIVYGESLERPVLFAVPWPVVRDAILRDGSKRGDKSLSPGDLEPHRVPNGEVYLARFQSEAQ